MTTAKNTTEQAILDTLSKRQGMTSVEIAAAAKRGKSTVGKALAKMEREGKVTRESDRSDSGGRRQPDRWSATRPKASGGRPSKVKTSSSGRT